MNRSGTRKCHAEPQWAALLFILFKNNFISLLLTGLGLYCCTWAFSGCSEQGLLSAAVLRLLSGVAPLGAEHRPGARGLRGCSTRAELPCSMWNPPGLGIKPVSPALADGVLSTGTPGESNGSL